MYDELINIWKTKSVVWRTKIVIGCVAGSWRRILCYLLMAGLGFAMAPQAARGQLGFPDSAVQTAPNPLTDPTMNPGKMLLFDLEARFAKDVLARGGAAFAEWFAEDGVALSNGQPPKVGRVAIAKTANWSAKDYLLTWTPTDGVMGPSGDMGYTWGPFEGHSKDAHGNPVVTTGRYTTVWRKQPNGDWKVILDVGSNEPAEAGDCCKLPVGS
jgi:ketosteroid isomerase-like protein